MTTTLPGVPSAVHIAHELWAVRHLFRSLQDAEFYNEMSLLNAVQSDLSKQFFHDYSSAVSFYRDLNRSFQEMKHGC